MEERIIDLKNTGSRLIGVRYTFRCLVEKFVLEVEGIEAKEACGTDQMCEVIESVIEGGIHYIRLLCQNNTQEEDWVFIIVDTHNSFNE